MNNQIIKEFLEFFSESKIDDSYKALMGEVPLKRDDIAIQYFNDLVFDIVHDLSNVNRYKFLEFLRAFKRKYKN